MIATTKILREIGLTKNEETIFLNLIKNEDSTGAKIAKLTGMDKSSAYRAIDTLVIKGLVKANVKTRGSTYRINSLDSLQNYYDSKKAEFESKDFILKSFIESLKKDFREKRTTNIYIEEGLDAHIKRMEESLGSKEKVIRERFRNHSIFKNDTYTKYVQDYVERRRKLGIFIYQLEQDYGEMYKKFPKIMSETEFYLKEIRKAPKSMDDNNSFRIYDDIVNIMSYDENDEFIVITIKDKYVSQLMKNMYDVIWDISKKIN